jgi:MFS family permease
MSHTTAHGDTKRFAIRLTGLKPGTSQEEVVAALQRIFPRQTGEDIHQALARLPLLLTKSATEEQAKKLKTFLEARGAVLKFMRSSPASEAPRGKHYAVPAAAGAPAPVSGVGAQEAAFAEPRKTSYTGVERRVKPRVNPGITINPMGVGEILDRSFRLLRQNFLLFFIILMIPQGTFFLCSKGMSIFVKGGVQQSISANMGIGLGISAVFAVLVLVTIQFWAQGALVYAVSETYLGHKTSVGSSYGAMRTRLGRLLGTMILVGVLLGLLFLILFFLGGLVMGVLRSAGRWFGAAGMIIVCILGAVVFFHCVLNWLLVDKVVVLEDKAWFKALRRSTELMKSRTEQGFWKRPKNKAGLILLLGFLIGIGIHLLFQVPGLLGRMFVPIGTTVTWQTVQQILNVVATSLAAVFTAIAMILYYYDIRLRSEGFDLKMMAEHL